MDRQLRFRPVMTGSVIICILIFLAVLYLRPYFGTVTAALFNAEEAVQIEPNTIESSTLIIGTHLIYLHALHDEIYAIAVESASSSGQDKRYYKSELAGGMWIDITEAGSIRDITAAGKTVDENEIRGLYFTHHTKSDGITYDLRTNAQVCIFDIIDVYDLEYLPELESLKTQYDMMKESGSSTRTARRNLELVRAFFAMQVQSDMTSQCDAQIQALQGYYIELVTNEADSRDAGMVLKVMEKVDNARKAAVFTMVYDGLSSLQENVAKVEDSDGELELDDTLLTAIGNSQYALSESLNEAQGNMLARGNTVISETEYTLSNRMISNAESRNYAGCDEQNKKLQNLDDISNVRIVSRQEELALLDEMIDTADIRYGLKLSEGMTEPYRTFVSQNVSHAALQSRMREDMSEANAARSELEFFIQGKTDRQEKEEAQKYILMRIQDAAKFQVVIQADDYQQEFQNSVSAYVDWLNSLLSGLSSKNRKDSSQNREESIYEQKAALQEQKLQALDDLDLDTAKRIDAKIADLDQKIGVSEDTAADRLEELTQKKTTLEKQIAQDPQNAALQAERSRMEVEIANCRLGIPDNSQTANIMACRDEALNLLAKGDTSDAALDQLERDVDLLTSMLEDGSALALEASKEVYSKLLAKSELEGVKAYEELQEQIEQAVSESVVNNNLTGEMSVQRAGTIIADALGIEDAVNLNASNLNANASNEDMAAALIALGDFSKTNGETNPEQGAAGSIQAFAESLAAAASQDEGSAVFLPIKQGEESYVPAEKLAAYLGYRYVWNDTKKNGILSRGRYFFSFTAFRDSVENEKGEFVYMDHPAGFSGGLYIPVSFVKEGFDCSVQDITGTDYAVFVNDEVAEKSQEILDALQEQGGYGWE